MSGPAPGEFDQGMEAVAALERPEVFKGNSATLLEATGAFYVSISKADEDGPLPAAIQDLYDNARRKTEAYLEGMGFAMHEGDPGLSTDLLDELNTKPDKLNALDNYLSDIDPSKPHYDFMNADRNTRVRIDYDSFITFAEGTTGIYNTAQELAYALKAQKLQDTRIEPMLDTMQQKLTFLGEYVDAAADRNDKTQQDFNAFKATGRQGDYKDYLAASAFSRGEDGFN